MLSIIPTKIMILVFVHLDRNLLLYCMSRPSSQQPIQPFRCSHNRLSLMAQFSCYRCLKGKLGQRRVEHRETFGEEASMFSLLLGSTTLVLVVTRIGRGMCVGMRRRHRTRVSSQRHTP